MKREIRVIGIDDVAFDKFKDKKARVIGVIYRGGSFMDGILSTTVNVDGSDSTARIGRMIGRSKFLPQLQCIFLDGIAVAGFNVIDIHGLNRQTGLPVIVVMRDYPDLEKIFNVLKRLKMGRKIKLLEKAGRIYAHKKIHFQAAGISPGEARELLSLTSTHSYIPEPIRAAHLIGQGLALGESKGRA